MSKNAAVGGLVVVVLAGLAWVGWQLLGEAPGDNPDTAGRGTLAGQSEEADTPDRASSPGPDLAASRDQVDSVAGGTDLATSGPRPALATAAFLSGQVTDELGVPIADASVSYGINVAPAFALLGLRVDAPAERKVTGTTNGAGQFKLPGVPRGEGAVLMVEHPDHQPLSRGNLHPPSTGLDLGQLQMQKGATVTGRVVGPRGEPVAAAKVVFQPDMQAALERSIRSPLGGLGGGSSRETETLEDGTFRLAGLGELPGTVEASKKGLDRAISELLELEPGVVTGGVQLALGTGLSIQGVVHDPDGNPVAGAEVTWFGGESSPFRMASFLRPQDGDQKTLTGADGRFLLEGLSKGTYGVTAQAGGFAAHTVDGIQAGERDPVVVVLKPGGEATCRVLDTKTGEPISHARIRAQEQDGGYAQLLQGLDSGEESPTDSPDPGQYLVRDLKAGTYTLQVEAGGYVTGATEPFEVGAGQRADAGVINLMPAASIAGRVVTEQGDLPVEGAQVTARGKIQDDEPQIFNVAGQRRMSLRLAAPAGGGGGMRLANLGGEITRRAVTDAEGRFELQDLAPGEYELLVEHWDHAPRNTDSIAVEAGDQHDDVEVALTEGGTLEGISLGPTGTPRPGDTIAVHCPSVAGVTLRGTADAQGLYLIEHVPAGEHTAKRDGASHTAGYAGANTPVMVLSMDQATDKGQAFTIKDGETVRLDFLEGESASLYGDVTSALGAAPGTEVRLHKRQGDEEPQFFFQPEAAVTVDAAGRYELGPVAAGEYTVEVKHPKALVPIREPITLLAGAPQRQDFFLEGAVVEGRVFAPGGRPLSGATVRLEKVQDDSQPQATAHFATMVMIGRSSTSGRGGSFLQTTIGGDAARTEQDGSYQIEWVPDGRYQVKVDHPDYLSGESPVLEIKNHKNARGVDVKLEEGGTLLVQTTMEDTGRPAPQRMVQIDKEGGGGHQIQMSDDQGEVIFRGLDPGTWTVSSAAFGGNEAKTGPQAVNVFAGQETRATIQF